MEKKLTPDPYYIKEATADVVPIIISSPHSGTAFPDELINDYNETQLHSLDDTDWFLHDLYDFAPSMGITMIHAKYSRWVIDLNRDPDSKPLYDDGRIITSLTTTTNFTGKPIYKEVKEPDQVEIERRLSQYYWPYYMKIQGLLELRLEQFGKVLLWDAHSIRSLVPTIRKNVFPEMILGDNDEKSSSQELIDITLSNLSSVYEVNHNDPFKGGHITRYFGNPNKNIHALQLERCKTLYMDDSERDFHPERADKMRTVLKQNFEDLIAVLS